MTASWWHKAEPEAILRAPPFPGSQYPLLARSASSATASVAPEDINACLEEMKRLRVGGAFWAKQPTLANAPPIIARPSSPAQALFMLDAAQHDGTSLLFWFPTESAAHAIAPQEMPAIIGPCDPWHLFPQARAIWVDGNDETALLAAIAQCPVRIFGEGAYASLASGESDDLIAAARRSLFENLLYIEPFYGRPAQPQEIIRLLGHWRNLIDANRPIRAVFGIAFWKRGAVEPLLWDGDGPVPFQSATTDGLQHQSRNGAVAIWKARVPPSFLEETKHIDGPVLEVEDGFIRSAGLGADCVPPLSIVVDGLCAHYDPSGPSGLENLLVNGEFPPELLRRAEELQRLIITTGISKYAVGQASAARRGGNRKHVLVTGQVEDDRSVLCGGGNVTGNLDLLRRVRALEPGSYILYRPHPDVDAGHRKGHIPDSEVLTLADEIARTTPITALIDMADHMHVLTSLAGFEALIRGKPVTTHGVPFYAGWGLTTDLGPVPVRRNVQRSVAELIAATLLLYPRYLDPLTALPCPPEVLIERLAAGVKKENSVIVLLRRLQGMFMRTMKGF